MLPRSNTASATRQSASRQAVKRCGRGWRFTRQICVYYAATSKDGVWNVEYARRAAARRSALSRLPAGVPLTPLARRVSPLGVWEEAGEA
jgi:hypothetical protein